MADFTEFKEKAADFAMSAAEKAKDLASFAADKAKRVGRIAKLNIEIAAEKDKVRKAYVEIGKLYYETHKDAPEGFFIQLCEEVAASNEAVADKEAELEELKASVQDCDEPLDVDFETVVTETAAPAAEDEVPAAEDCPPEA